MLSREDRVALPILTWASKAIPDAVSAHAYIRAVSRQLCQLADSGVQVFRVAEMVSNGHVLGWMSGTRPATDAATFRDAIRDASRVAIATVPAGERVSA